ncbi:L-threonylcarbamoyladenylate synthase [Halovenus halobia]|uniref:L-threonylcarbamoyladenylate synthase n=1 Tax=Halovenus halobia TaxID=3396622 RepID=UPI003F549F89
MTGLDFDRAARAISDGKLVVYPTETVYGLGADALDADAVEGVFDAKDRDRSKPVSMAVPDIETAAEYTILADRERAFIAEFLPGPVTVVVEAGPQVPDVLTAGRDRVGIRIPDHDAALKLLDHTGPITATSANVSGTGSVRDPDALAARIRQRAAVILDTGTAPGGGSTVVDVSADTIHRRGKEADAVADWLSA